MTVSVADAERLSEASGIRCLPVSTPFSVGAVNAYLLEGEHPVLIDTGPNLATSLAELEAGLASCGRRLEDLGAIVVTHLHVDHLGLTGLIAQRSGADVICLARAAESALDYPAYVARNDEYAATLMLQHGVDPAVVQSLRPVSGLARAFGASLVTTIPVDDGTELELGGRSVVVHERPGHSPFDIVLLDREHQILFSGDHLLSQISSNALITRPAGVEDPSRRPQPLLEYRASMLATRELDCQIALGGHGPAVTDPVDLIDARIRDQDRRAEQILRLLGDGPRSAHEIARQMWGSIAFTEAFLTISEVLGHLDLLIAAGKVVEHELEPVHFERR